jgi:hypothetical protein
MSEYSTISPQTISTPAAAITEIVSVQEKMRHGSEIKSLQRLSIQRKLTIGAVNDPLEAEADAVADLVMRMPMSGTPVFSGTIPAIQRQCTACAHEEELQRKPIAETIRRKGDGGGQAASPAITSSIHATSGSGSRMDDTTQSFMESRFGTDFSSVNIHTGDYAVQLSRDLNAKAFTVGNDIYFNSGQYNPGSDSGKHLLAHELTHTVQQGGNAAGIQRRSWTDDESGCTTTQKILVQLIFDDNDADVWTTARKNTFRNDFKSSIESTFNANSFKITPAVASAEPWYSDTSETCPCHPNGFAPRVQIDLTPDGEISTSEDWEIDVLANSSGTDIRSETNTSYGDLDEADNTAVTKRSSAPGVTQIPSVHEFGHFLGLDHPGAGLSAGVVIGGVEIIARELSPGANEYSHVGTDEDGHTVDGPNDLMGGGMGLRSFYFDSWLNHIQSKYLSGCNYNTV